MTPEGWGVVVATLVIAVAALSFAVVAFCRTAKEVQGE